MSLLIQEFVAKLGLDVNAMSFVKGQIAFKLIATAATKFLNVAAGMLRALPDAVSEVAAVGDRIDELAQQTGLSTDAIQEFSYAASFSGVSMQDMTRSLGFLARRMSDAQGGSKEAQKSFSDLGIAFQDTTGKLRDPGDVLTDLSTAFAAMPDGAKKTASSLELLSRSGKELIPFLNLGAEGIAKLRAEAHAIGQVLSPEVIKQAAEYSDNVDRSRMAWAGVRRTIGAELLPALNELAKDFVKWWTNGGRQQFIRGLGVIVRTLKVIWRIIRPVLKLSVFLLDAASRFVEYLLDNEDMLIAALTGIALAFAVVKGEAIAAGLLAAKAWLIAAAPILLMVGAIALLLLLFDDVQHWLDGAPSAIGDLLGPWEEFKNSLTTMNPNDPAWLRWLKQGVRLVTELIEALDSATWKTFVDTAGDILMAFVPEDLEARQRAEAAQLAMRVPRQAQALVNRTLRVGKIEIISQPGMNEKQLAQEVVRQVDDLVQKHFDRAMTDVDQ